MAPRVSRDYHSAVEPNSHWLRTPAKRSEDHFANITGKEEFLRSIGLQKKQYQCEYKMSKGRTGKINIPEGVTLRDCSVVVPGTTCKICGKTFKCVTDLIAHDAWKHRMWLRTDNNVDEESTYEGDSDSNKDNGGDNICEIVSESTEYSDISAAGSPARKRNSKLRVTLRIGTEVVARMTLKRKHLRQGNNSSNMATQTEPTHNADELIIGKGEGAVPRIDLPVFDNSPCQCCNSGLRVVNSTNQYLAGNIVTSQDTKCEKNTKDGSDRVRGLCATSVNEKVDALPDSLSIHKSQPEQNCAKDCNRDELFYLPNATENPRFCERDINANEKFVDTSGKQFQGSGLVSAVVVPIILPIVVPNAKAVSTEEWRPSEQERLSSVSSAGNNDDDVQEVLRIVRGQNSHEEINHESPNRSEQEMLLRDAIRDMIRMEEQGWHLLEREPPRKKVRANGSSDARNRIQSEDWAKRKRKAAPFDGDMVVRNAKKPKGLLSEVQNLYQNGIRTSDNVKENLMICNGNVNVPSEVLHRYGIGYYTETFEINNNTQTVQKPVSCLLAPCSGGMENRSNKPTIIDLVNDTDE